MGDLDLLTLYSGKGIYPVSMVSRLLDFSRATIYHWIKSYKAVKSQSSTKNLIWKPELILIDSKQYLTFRDILELRIIKIFRKHKINFRKIALLSKLISEKFDTENPLLKFRISTDGKEIYVAEDNNIACISNIASKRILLPGISTYIEKDIVEITNEKEKLEEISEEAHFVFNKEVSFDETMRPIAWKVDPKSFANIVLNPKLYGGYPTVDGIPTSTLYMRSEIEGGVLPVAQDFGIAEDLVREAIAFERIYFHQHDDLKGRALLH